jgi:hypothetical protein
VLLTLTLTLTLNTTTNPYPNPNPKGMGDIYSSILAMRSKASRIFLSPRQFLMDRKKEGAQEYLGDILY